MSYVKWNPRYFAVVENDMTLCPDEREVQLKFFVHLYFYIIIILVFIIYVLYIHIYIYIVYTYYYIILINILDKLIALQSLIEHTVKYICEKLHLVEFAFQCL